MIQIQRIHFSSTEPLLVAFSLSIIFLASFSQSSLFLASVVASQQPTRATTKSDSLIELPAGKKNASAGGDGKVVDLNNKLLFSIALGQEDKPQIAYRNSAEKISLVPNTDQTTLEKILKEEFKEPNSPDGVVIRVASNVKYEMVTALYSSIRAAMKKNQIDEPVYISVQEKAKQNPDEIRTQEFICKNKKAADLYDRVTNVARVFKVSVRLDPARNSITAKGPSSKVTAIQNLITYLDKPAGSPGNNPATVQPSTPPSKSGGTTLPPKKAANANDNKEPGKNIEPARVQPTKRGNSSTTESEMPIGRYQIAGIGDNLFMLDTATGESWFLDATQEEMRWIKLPHPTRDR